jgi:lysophospholipase L1-like esterase
MVRDRDGNASGVLSSVYGNAVGTGDATVWGFDPAASVVVVNLGTNDVNLGDPGAPYETAYADFVRTVRGKYPGAWIFLTIGSMLSGDQLTFVQGHLANVVTTLNDSKVITFDLGTQNLGSDGSVPTGCDWHPNAADHARMAGILEAQLESKLGW